MSTVKRFLKNTANGRVIAWSVAQAAKPGLIECDDEGRFLVEHVPVGDDADVMRILEDKVAECERLAKENAALTRDIKEYTRLHGPLEQQLPESDVDLAKTEPLSKDEHTQRAEAIKAQDSLVEEYGAMTKRKLVAVLEEKGVNASLSTTKNSLIQKLVDLEN